MRSEEFAGSPRGELVPTGEGAGAFVASPLPDSVKLSPDVVYQLDEASRAVALLAGIGETLPNPRLLIQPFLRREAVLSSRIEGTQASLSDVYELEASARPPAGDAVEVLNYVRAVEHGQRLLVDLPICNRLVKETHAVLMTGVRGEEARPGEYRDLQVWIGPERSPIEDARFVPAPPEHVERLMDAWESFVNADLKMPPLVQCALLHYQFETIHPFRDGNGRIGRLLTTLFLIERGVLSTPLLYLSAYLERHRQAYYDSLLEVSRTGDFSPWLMFFLTGVAEQASDAIDRSRRLRALHQEFRDRLQQAGESANALLMVDELFANPVTTRRRTAELLSVTTTGARGLLERLLAQRIVSAVPGTRPQAFVALEILDAIS